MKSADVQVRPAVLAKVVSELERGGAGQPLDIARRLGGEWTEDTVRAALAELFCDGVAGHSDEVGFWWVP